MITKINEYKEQLIIEKSDILQWMKSVETDDYQNRGNDYPDSGIPVNIRIWKNKLIFSFKGTSETTAKLWAERFISNAGYKPSIISTYQDGDYEDDWVNAIVEFDNYIQEALDANRITFNDTKLIAILDKLKNDNYYKSFNYRKKSDTVLHITALIDSGGETKLELDKQFDDGRGGIDYEDMGQELLFTTGEVKINITCTITNEKMTIDVTDCVYDGVSDDGDYNTFAHLKTEYIYSNLSYDEYIEQFEESIEGITKVNEYYIEWEDTNFSLN